MMLLIFLVELKSVQKILSLKYMSIHKQYESILLNFKLHLTDILLLKVSNIFHYWAVVFCSVNLAIYQNLLLHIFKETPSIFILTKVITKNPHQNTLQKYTNKK